MGLRVPVGTGGGQSQLLVLFFRRPSYFLFFVFSDRVSLDLELPQVGLASWPASPRGLPVSIPPVLKLHARTTTSSFVTWTLGIKLSLHACSVNPSPAEPHPLQAHAFKYGREVAANFGSVSGREKDKSGLLPLPPSTLCTHSV